MIEKLLDNCLRPVIEAEMRLRRRRVVGISLGAGALVLAGLIALAEVSGWWSWPVVFGWLGLVAAALLGGLWWAEKRRPDTRKLARRVEDAHPDLRAALLAALDQKPDADGRMGYLQERLVGDVAEHAVTHRWVRRVSNRRLAAAGWAQFAAILAFGMSIWLLLGEAPSVGPLAGGGENPKEEPGATTKSVSVDVSPGDVSLEKGSRLVIEAVFSGRIPADAMVVVTRGDGDRRIPMEVGLEDSVFSAMLPKVDRPGAYRVAWESDESDVFEIDVFEHPALSQVDAVVTPPEVVGGERREILDTRKITVMEGSRVEWRLAINKPVRDAELFGEDGSILPLEPDESDPTLLIATHEPTESRRYRVHLVDEEDRANHDPPWLTVNVKRNVPPELTLTFPGRDYEVSAVQELPVEGEVWDDVAVERAGLAYRIGDRREEITLKGETLPGGETHPLAARIDFEKLDARPRDLLTYHFWAEDRDNEGELRRVTSDMFFAEVRSFDQGMREGQPQQGGGQGQQQGDSGELLRLQKDVINAAWRLRRYHELGRPFDSFASDVEVVQESQLVVVSKVEGVIQKTRDPELQQIYTEAREIMERAAGEFGDTLEKQDGALIAAGHQTALDAYAKLIQARAREQQVSLSKSTGSGQSGQRQRRNMNLELEQKELKYEQQSQAQQSAKTEEQKENLAVLERLKELARRQEAIADKIKELEKQLQDADEEERSEIERQLERLREEQRELLREVDDLSERMDSEQNRSDMAREREKLQKTRRNVQDAAEKLESNDLASAANSATRAQRELQQMEEDFREKTSQRFSEEMRGLRQNARRLAENQEALGEELEQLERETSGENGEAQERRGELAQSLAGQAESLDALLEEMKQLSQESETSEPLLSESLYEAVRDAEMSGVGDSLEEARDFTFYDRGNRAREAERAAARGIEALKESVEEAAEKVLGSESDALRLARNELDQLIDQSRQEAERLSREGGAGGQSKSGEGAESPRDEQKGPPGAGEERKGERQGESQQGRPGESTGSSPAEQSKEGDRAGEESESREEGRGAGRQPSNEPGEGRSPSGEPGSQPGGRQPGREDEEGRESPGGQAPGQQPGQGDSSERMAGQGRNGEGQSPGGQSPGGQGQGQQPGQRPGEDGRPGREPGSQQGGALAGGSSDRRGVGGAGGDDRGAAPPQPGSANGPLFFQQESRRQSRPGPITGEDYEQWRDRLGAVEEMLSQDELRNRAARVRDEARALRSDFQRDNHPPGAAAIEQRITDPLVELRDRISEELSKMNEENPVAPIDRDPVPSEFRDLVRRYYEELGAGE